MAACCSNPGTSPRSKVGRTRCSRRSGGRRLRGGAHRRRGMRPARCPRSKTRCRANRSMPGAWPRHWAGMPASGRSGRPARPARARHWRSSSMARSTATARTATVPTARAPRGCRRTCISAKSLPGGSRPNWSARARPPTAPTWTATSASWAGVSSPTTCCTTSRRPPRRTSTRASRISTGRRSTPRPSRHGSTAAPASPSSTPACASCGPPATCTTGCA